MAQTGLLVTATRTRTFVFVSPMFQLLFVMPLSPNAADLIRMPE